MVIDLSQTQVDKKFAQLLAKTERFPMRIGGRLAVICPKNRFIVSLQNDSRYSPEPAKISRLTDAELKELIQANELFSDLQTDEVDIVVFKHNDFRFDRLQLEISTRVRSWQLPVICKSVHLE
jgi:hypothetical protein